MFLSLLSQLVFRAEGDDGAPSTPPAGSGGAAEQTFTQDELNRIVGERLARAKTQFEAEHDLPTLTAKAAELDRANADQAEKDRAKADAALLKTGDADKIRADYDARLAAKDDAAAVKEQMFTGKLRDAFANIAMARVADQLHEEAKPTFAGMVRDRLGVTFDVETQKVDVFPVGESGQRAYDAQGDPLTIDATVKGLLEGNAFMRLPTAGGSGSAAPGGSPTVGQLERSKEIATKHPTRDALAGMLGAIVSQ